MSFIALAALSEGFASEIRNVLKEVPASAPEEKELEVEAIVAAKSSNETPAAAATPPPWAIARLISSTPNFDTLAAPATLFTMPVSSEAAIPQTVIAVAATFAAVVRSVPPAAASATTASAAPPMMSAVATPPAASSCMASTACDALNAVSAPICIALARRPSISCLVAPATACTPESPFSKSAAIFRDARPTPAIPAVSPSESLVIPSRFLLASSLAVTRTLTSFPKAGRLQHREVGFDPCRVTHDLHGRAAVTARQRLDLYGSGQP